MVNKKRVPDRWREYKSCSWTPIKNERIISFKTPLSKKFATGMEGDEGLVHSERFTPSDLINELDKKSLHLGMVLDFTFTKRYYDPTELTEKGIIYKKMMCPGHEIPKEEDIKRFEYEVFSFLENDKTGALVGVHCTHGINRTGYMVCRYLIDCKGYEPEDAIKAFNDARGYPIERENYLEDLKLRKPRHDVDFKDYSKELSRQEMNSKEREPDKPRNYREIYDRKRRFHREDNWADDFVPDFSSPGKYAWTDQYDDQEPRHSSRHTNRSHSTHTRPYRNHNYDRRNNHPRDRRIDYQRYDPYYPCHYGNHDSELGWYENDYRWHRNDRNFDPQRHRYRYK
ncbi:RNA/RNP complex-1-interacting phosphatase homolog [Actinia tenebrosa]|uniref:RNA/RNP complex-1-interacting phosphatase homolog n=1 Tax=Actinia tenebrosa TaxID=6105 RepID=A0A6P8J4X0_ACTTE|nr:RNA/RNP complex-1-interacting phosphatase homolog [Actinia tenebrosa]